MIDFTKPKIMGVLNLTPDSFSDGGKYNSPEVAIEKINEMIKERADIIDVGGESTRPGSTDVSPEEELRRVNPIIDHVSGSKLLSRAIFSIDTYKSRVAEYAINHGFQIVNDITALRGDPNMINLLLRRKPYTVLMYAKDKTPRATKIDVQYKDVVATIKEFLKGRISFLVKSGFPKEKIIIDPGMGAFISADKKYSFEIVERLGELKEFGLPILIGISRKLFSGLFENRDIASISLTKLAIKNGASIIRVHNVKLAKKILKTKI